MGVDRPRGQHGVGRRLLDRLVGPVPLPFGPLLDPSKQDRQLLGIQLVSKVRRRHALVSGGVGDPAGQLASGDVTGTDERKTARPPFAEALRNVEAEVCLPLSPVRAVALEAMLGEDGANVPTETERTLLDGGMKECDQTDNGEHDFAASLVGVAPGGKQAPPVAPSGYMGTI